MKAFDEAPRQDATDGTPERAAQLKALWVPEDFPCCGWFPRLVKGVLTCPSCGEAFVFVGQGRAFHPNTPALAAALTENYSNEELRYEVAI